MRALAAALAAAAVLAGGASAAPVIEEVQASASASAATVAWRTSVPTRGRVGYGVGGLYLWSEREGVASTAHTVTLPDLNPSTTYEFRIVAATASATGSVTTSARGDVLQFGVDGTHVTANGSLFFPVLSIEQCADTIDRALAMGVNAFAQVPFTGCSTPADVVPPYLLSEDYGTEHGIGWYLPDEPDGWGITPEQMPHLPPAAETGRLRFVTLSQHFFSGQAPINNDFDRNDYKRFAALGDVVGFDMYPIAKFCGRIPLLDVYRAQRELMTVYAPGKPTYQWIETSRMTGECTGMEVTPEIVNAEVWLAVAGGACGLGLFTNSWTSGMWNRWDFDPGVEQQLARTVARVQSLAPALCKGDHGNVVLPWDGSVVASSRTLNGAVYVIAVNGAATPTTVPFRVDGLVGRALTVLDEHRTIKPMKRVFFRDRFAPYEVHLYVAPPAP